MSEASLRRYRAVLERMAIAILPSPSNSLPKGKRFKQFSEIFCGGQLAGCHLCMGELMVDLVGALSWGQLAYLEVRSARRGCVLGAN